MAKKKAPLLVRAWRKVVKYWRRFKLWYKGLYTGKPWWRKTLVALATLVVLFVVYLLMVSCNFLWLFGSSPSLSEIMNPKTNNASYIYSSDGVLIGKFYSENRTPVKFEEINPVFFDALIDTEDERFYSHWGIDVAGLGGALKDMVVHGNARGGSTITQQLVKNMFRVRKSSTGLLGHVPGVKLVIMKTKEWILATEVELIYRDKQRILEMYANTVDYGNNAFGIKTAAHTYFNTTPAQLTTEQCATLVGVLKGTTLYNPRRNPERCLERRNVVLRNMLNHGHLTATQYDSISKLPLALEFTPDEEITGVGPYFKQAVVEELKDWAEANKMDIFTDGLDIYTTLDTRMQRHAEQAVWQQMQAIQQSFDQHWGDNDCWTDEEGNVIEGFAQDVAQNSDYYKQLLARYGESDFDSIDHYMNLPHEVKIFDYNGGHHATMTSIDSVKTMLHKMHCGLVAMDPATGEVKAWVGDVDYNTWKYDQVRAMHQPGSTFKLFVYSAAMERGMRPCDRRMDSYFDTLVENKQTHELERWAPHNANGRFSNSNITLRQAFAQSTNVVAVRVGNEVGPSQVALTAQDMGITSPLDITPALALGASDVNLLEMVNSYCTVAADGMAREPVLVTKIYQKDSYGKRTLVYDCHAAKNAPHRALSHRAAYFMLKLLQAGLTDAGGTSQALNRYIPWDTDFGGKTGTSNNHADAWFIAVSPHLVCGAWVGGEYRQIHFRTGALGQGSRTALPVVGNFLQRVMNDRNFAHLHGRFKADATLDHVALLCSPELNDTLPADSTAVDSLRVDDAAALTPVDDNGNPVPAGGEQPTDHNSAITPEQQSQERVKKAYNNPSNN